MNRRHPPEHLEPFLSRNQIRARVRTIARQIDPWAGATTDGGGEEPLLALCVLRGGFLFFGDLLQELTHSVEPAFCRAHAYAKAVNGRSSKRLRIDLAPGLVRNRAVLLVDNICDSGRTLALLAARCRREGAREVRSAVLIHRSRDDSQHVPDYAGLTHAGPEWFAGYGLRDGNCAMNFPEVFRVVRRPGSLPRGKSPD
jgi:hypoxanthine phosphoribosyltransferase